MLYVLVIISMANRWTYSSLPDLLFREEHMVKAQCRRSCKECVVAVRGSAHSLSFLICLLEGGICAFWALCDMITAFFRLHISRSVIWCRRRPTQWGINIEQQNGQIFFLFCTFLLKMLPVKLVSILLYIWQTFVFHSKVIY